MLLLESTSVQTWFASKPYDEPTKRNYLIYLTVFCGLLNMTPDQLACVAAEEASRIQHKLSAAMKQEFRFRDHKIADRISVLHAFWNANGVQLTTDILKYDGAPTVFRAVKANPKARA